VAKESLLVVFDCLNTVTCIAWNSLQIKASMNANEVAAWL